MSPCEREDELTEVIRDGRWPALADSELARHARTCPACSDVVIVATAILEDHQRALKSANVATPGAAWWRVQRRAAAETVRIANRTVFVVQMMSCLAALAMAVTVVGTFGEWRAWLQALVRYVTFDGVQIANVAPLALAVIACVTLAPVAVYLAVARD
jgi:hypothetical protein